MKRPTKQERMQGWLNYGIQFIFTNDKVALKFPKEFIGNRNGIAITVRKDFKEYKNIHKSLVNYNIREAFKKSVVEKLKESADPKNEAMPEEKDPKFEVNPDNPDRLKNGFFAPGNKIGKAHWNPAIKVMSKVSLEDLEKIRDAHVKMAVEGDVKSAQFIFSYVDKCINTSPKLKALPTANTEQLATAMDTVIEEFIEGSINQEMAECTMRLLNTKREFIVTSEFHDRLKKIEQRVSEKT